MRVVERIDTRRREDSPFKIILDEQSVEWNRERQAARGDRARSLYASDYGSCMRKTFFQFFPEEFPQDEGDARLMRIFHNGELVHERLQEYLRKSGIVFLEEVDVPRDELDVHGRCDGVAMLDGQFHVLEFKSMNAREVFKPKDEHLGQLTWYMGMWERRRLQLRDELGFPEGFVPEDLDERMLEGREDIGLVDKMLLLSVGPVKGELIYESKQNQELFTFPVDMDWGMFEKVRSWFDILWRHVLSGEVPVVRYDKTKYPCAFGLGRCVFWDRCHGSSG